MFSVEPLTSNCAQLRGATSHACIGISPFNSYFTLERIQDLARWSFDNFPHCHFFVPDAPSAYTLEAVGYEPGKAKRKAHRQSQYTHNKIVRALTELGVDDPRQHILGFDVLDKNERYQELHQRACHLFETNEFFREAALNTSEWVLDKRLPAGVHPEEWQRLLAVRYFLAEIPLFVNTYEIVGQPSSVFLYHQRVDFLERLYGGELPWRPDPGQGFLVVNPVDDRQPAISVGVS